MAEYMFVNGGASDGDLDTLSNWLVSDGMGGWNPAVSLPTVGDTAVSAVVILSGTFSGDSIVSTSHAEGGTFNGDATLAGRSGSVNFNGDVIVNYNANDNGAQLWACNVVGTTTFNLAAGQAGVINNGGTYTGLVTFNGGDSAIVGATFLGGVKVVDGTLCIVPDTGTGDPVVLDGCVIEVQSETRQSLCYIVKGFNALSLVGTTFLGSGTLANSIMLDLTGNNIVGSNDLAARAFDSLFPTAGRIWTGTTYLCGRNTGTLNIPTVDLRAGVIGDDSTLNVAWNGPLLNPFLKQDANTYTSTGGDNQGTLSRGETAWAISADTGTYIGPQATQLPDGVYDNGFGDTITLSFPDLVIAGNLAVPAAAEVLLGTTVGVDALRVYDNNLAVWYEATRDGLESYSFYGSGGMNTSTLARGESGWAIVTESSGDTLIGPSGPDPLGDYVGNIFTARVALPVGTLVQNPAYPAWMHLGPGSVLPAGPSDPGQVTTGSSFIWTQSNETLGVFPISALSGAINVGLGWHAVEAGWGTDIWVDGGEPPHTIKWMDVGGDTRWWLHDFTDDSYWPGPTDPTNCFGDYTSPNDASVATLIWVTGSATLEAHPNLVLPTTGQVLESTVFGWDGNVITGDLRVPVFTDVRDGVQYGQSLNEYTGVLALPDIADVLRDVQFGANGTEFTGTLDCGTGPIPVTPPAAPVVVGADAATKRLVWIKGQAVAITAATPSALIWYTLDGTDPRTSRGILYEMPFIPAETCTITAVCAIGKIFSGLTIVNLALRERDLTPEPVRRQFDPYAGR